MLLNYAHKVLQGRKYSSLLRPDLNKAWNSNRRDISVKIQDNLGQKRHITTLNEKIQNYREYWNYAKKFGTN
jgi:hypothetical protein